MPMILIIDDKQDNLISISALLRNLIPGCTVKTAQSGVKGIEKANADLPDTILLDINMPVMDGYEVCKTLKSKKNTKYVPIIMLTAIKIDLKDRIKGLDSGADIFITKPIDEAELIAQVNAALRIKKAEDDLCKEKAELIKINAQLQQEIIERKQADKALRESEERFRTLVENAPIGFFIMNTFGDLEYINPKSIQIFGYTIEDIPSMQSWLETAYPDQDYRKQVILDWNETIKHQKDTPSRFKVRCKDGKEKIINLHAVTLKDGKIIVTVEDITNQARACEQVEKSKATLQAVCDGISDPLIMFDKKLSVKMLNRAALTYYQVSEFSNILGRHCVDVFRGKTTPCEGCKICSAVQRGKKKLFEQKSLLYPDRYEQIEVYPLQKEKTEETRGAIVRISDITEKKKTEEQLVRADRLSSLGQLSGGIAHEIRNPLSSISLFTDILLEKKKFLHTDQELEILNEIKDNVNRISRIIKGVLDFSRTSISSKRMTDINSVIEDTIQLWLTRMRKSEIKLKLNIDKNLPQVLGDPVQLQQVMNNLILNALEAMEKGGILTVSAFKGISSVYRDREMVHINVKDTGCGIDPEDRENVFNPFFTTKPTGTGLGMAISHKIIECHGGIITFESKRGEGTTFSIELPACLRN